MSKRSLTVLLAITVHLADGTNAVSQLGNTLQSVAAQMTTPSQTPSQVLTVPLRKQYVPVERDGRVIAYKTSYFGDLHMGAPEPQHFTVVFDTGSGHVILPSVACRSETCMKHRRYNRLLSSKALEIEYDGTPIAAGALERDQVSISFGTGQVLGEFVSDSVCIQASQPTADDKTATCAGLRVVLATEMSPEPFGLFSFDGVLGLGLQALALSPEFNFFTQLAEQNPSLRPQFSFFLAQREGDESAITFGGHEEERAASDVQWVPVSRPELGYWQVSVRKVLVGDTVLEDCANGSCHAILDTGSSMFGVPKQSSRLLQRLLAREAPQDADPSAIDCRRVDGPELKMELEVPGSGPVVVTLGAEQIGRPAPVNMSMPVAEGQAPGAPKLVCRSLLLPVAMQEPLGPNVFILGEPALRKYYTVYDLAEKRVGFALARRSEASMGTVGERSSIGAPPASHALVSGAPLPA